jgi:hypothetical protein
LKKVMSPFFTETPTHFPEFSFPVWGGGGSMWLDPKPLRFVCDCYISLTYASKAISLIWKWQLLSTSLTDWSQAIDTLSYIGEECLIRKPNHGTEVFDPSHAFMVSRKLLDLLLDSSVYLRLWLYDRGPPAVSYKWAGWVWEITGWSLWLQENYRSF